MKPKIFAFLFSIFYFLFSVGSAFAATRLYLNSDIWTVGVGQETHVQISIDTTERVNAFRLALAYPLDTFEYAGWSDGASIVGAWITRPAAQNGTVLLEGAIPGGFEGDNGLLVTLVFRGVRQGANQIQVMSDSRLYANDGNGSVIPFDTRPFRFRVVPSGEGAPAPYTGVFKDSTPPEQFTPLVARDESMFDGKWFAVFETQDKDSGIARYDIAESNFSCSVVSRGAWKEAQSPVVLSDQSRRSFVCIRATDREGNERVASVAPLSNAGSLSSSFRVPWGILIGAAALGVLVNMILRRRRAS